MVKYPGKKTSLPALPVYDQVALYDLLASAGLHPLPRQTGGKFPVAALWKGQKRLPVDRAEALALSEGVGWVIQPDMENLNLVVLDLDINDLSDPAGLYNYIQELSPSDFVISSPSGGCHIYYQVDDDVMLSRHVHPRPEYPGLELRHRGIGVGVTSLGSFWQYEGKYATGKGVQTGFIGAYEAAEGADLSNIPHATQQLIDWLGQAVETELDIEISPVSADLNTAALDFLIEKWGQNRPYEDWVRLWMSCHLAFDGSLDIQTRLNTDIYWERDTPDEHKKFYQAWARFEPRDSGYNVRSLTKFAREEGWKHHISDVSRIDSEINVRWVSDWVKTADLPKKLLLKSQTGSGKTQALAAIWHKLGKPKTVVFVPTVKLALNMAHILTGLGLPAVAYRDASDHIRDGAILYHADILVTTMQTFTKKVYGDGRLEGYGLFYIEECDQLLGSYASAGGDKHSHVTHAQAEAGFKLLKAALEDPDLYVIGVDATMTNVSVRTFVSLAPDTKVIINDYVVPKSEVTMLDTLDTAYTIIAQALLEGQTVVVPADTAAASRKIVDVMVGCGLVEKDRAIAVTAKRDAVDKRVGRFIRNANQEAANYRLIAYSTAMGSGVSITEYTPDVIVQVATAYLPPRVQLQLLNRCRNQHQVYCYYAGLKTEAEPDTVELAQERASIEAMYLGLPLIERSDLAQLRDQVRSVLVMDEAVQRVDAPAYYVRLLKNEDGREVHYARSQRLPEALYAASKLVGETYAAEREHLANHWIDTPPCSDVAKMPETYTPEQITQAIIHQWIIDVLGGDIPLNVPPAYIFNTVRRLHTKIPALMAFVKQSEVIRQAEIELSSVERGYLAMRPRVARTVIVAMLRYIFHDLKEKVKDVEERTQAFRLRLSEDTGLYSAVVKTKGKSLEELGDDHFAVAKTIGKTAGINIKKDQTGWYIANIQEINDLLTWIEHTPVELDLDITLLKQGRKHRESLRRSLVERVMQSGIVERLPLDVALSIKEW